jgi:hypothetical protein
MPLAFRIEQTEAGAWIGTLAGAPITDEWPAASKETLIDLVVGMAQDDCAQSQPWTAVQVTMPDADGAEQIVWCGGEEKAAEAA